MAAGFELSWLAYPDMDAGSCCLAYLDMDAGLCCPGWQALIWMQARAVWLACLDMAVPWLACLDMDAQPARFKMGW